MAAVAVLLAALALQFALPGTGPGAWVSALAPRRPLAVVPPPVPEYAAILRAPIFAPDRKPGPSALAAPGGGPLSGYAALGVAIDRSGATAVISGPQNSTRTVRTGESVEGWRLVSIERTRVTFERDGARQSLVVGSPPEVLSQAGAATPAGAR
jgi:hypothetical protein